MKSLEKHSKLFTILGIILSIISCVLASILAFPSFFDSIIGFSRNLNSVSINIFENNLETPDFFTISNPNGSEVLDLSELDKPTFPNGGFLVIAVKNSHSMDEVILEDYLPIELLSYRPPGNEEDYINIVEPIFERPPGIGGGPQSFWNFISTIDPNSGKQFPAIFDEYGQETIDFYGFHGDQLAGNNSEYFVVDPGETILMAIRVQFTKPGVYEFKSGISYYKNSRKIENKWIDEKFSVYIPNKLKVWKCPVNDPPLINMGNCTYEKACYFVGAPYLEPYYYWDGYNCSN